MSDTPPRQLVYSLVEKPEEHYAAIGLCLYASLDGLKKGLVGMLSERRQDAIDGEWSCDDAEFVECLDEASNWTADAPLTIHTPDGYIYSLNVEEIMP